MGAFGTGRQPFRWRNFRPAMWGIFRLFGTFDASHGAGPPAAVSAPYGKTRARRSSKPARPYIWRLIILRRLIWPSTWPVLQGVSTAAATAEMSFWRP